MRDDLKNAIRSLCHSPTFTAVALIVLALGIGAATALYSIVDAVVLRGLPFDEHDRMMAVLEYDTTMDAFGSGNIMRRCNYSWTIVGCTAPESS
jgi:putative ABC transport system permease protein